MNQIVRLNTTITLGDPKFGVLIESDATNHYVLLSDQTLLTIPNATYTANAKACYNLIDKLAVADQVDLVGKESEVASWVSDIEAKRNE